MKRTLLAAASALALTVASAHAQFAVIDVANLAENIIVAAQTLQQVDNQIAQIQQGIQMLENDARNLASLPFSVVNELNADINAVNGLMGRAQGLVFQVGQIDQQFQQLYPASDAAASDAQLLQNAQARWQVSLQGLQHAMDVQSQIAANLPDDQQQMSDLVGQSQGAVGALEAAQAGNQLVALNTKQVLQLQALIASQARMQATEMARSAAEEEDAAERTRRFIGTGPVYTPVPVQAFH